jgi:hypothetical protein
MSIKTSVNTGTCTAMLLILHKSQPICDQVVCVAILLCERECNQSSHRRLLRAVPVNATGDFSFLYYKETSQIISLDTIRVWLTRKNNK